MSIETSSSFLPVQIGVELEFVGPGPEYLSNVLRERQGLNTSWDGDRHTWCFGNDCSVFDRYSGNIERDDHGCEFRTPVILNPSFNPAQPHTGLDESMATFRKIVRWLNPICIVTKSCGMHVHISCENRNAEVDLRSLAEELDERFRKFAYRCRHTYCHPGSSREDKYHTVREVEGNHVEVRIFNGTLEWGKICRRLAATIELYRKYLSLNGVDGFGQPI